MEVIIILFSGSRLYNTSGAHIYCRCPSGSTHRGYRHTHIMAPVTSDSEALCEGPQLCREPQLREDKLQLMKAQVRDAIDHESDSKNAVAMRAIRHLLYGPDSLYTRRATVEGVSSITRESVRQWLNAYHRALQFWAAMFSLHRNASGCCDPPDGAAAEMCS
jgi:hypothetical protein